MPVEVDKRASLLSDYHERNADYRRQLRLATTGLSTGFALLLLVSGWVASSTPEARPLWMLPLAVGLTNIVLLILLFVYRVTQLMLNYMLAIEVDLGDAADSWAADVSKSASDAARVGFMNYYVWKARSRSGLRSRSWRVALKILLSVSLILFEGVMVYFGLLDSLFSGTVVRVLIALGAFVLPVSGCVALYLILSRQSRREREAIVNRQSAPLDNGRSRSMFRITNEGYDFQDVLLVDFAERNEDARFLFGYYASFLLWAATAFTTLFGLWVEDRAREWVFLLVPPFVLAYGFADTLVYRLSRELKVYLVALERCIDVHTSDPREGASTHYSRSADRRYTVGFFGYVRSRFVEDADTSRVPVYLLVLNSMIALGLICLLGTCVMRGLAWLEAQTDVRVVALLYWGLVGTLLAADVALLFSAKRMKRVPPQCRMESLDDRSNP